MVITQDLTQCHIQARVVTIIVKAPHLLQVIKPNYHLKPKKVIAQACPPRFEQSFLITYPF